MSVSRRHAGFTLIELVIVIGIMLFLAALAVRFMPVAYNDGREADAARNVQSWFDIAKQRAQRDQAPRGVRLWIDQTKVDPTVGPPFSNSMLQVSECEYIEQPDPYTGDKMYTDPTNLFLVYFDPGGAAPTPDICNGQFTPNAVTGKYDRWLVQEGDILQLSGGQSFLIKDYKGLVTWPAHPPAVRPLNPEIWPYPSVGVVKKVQAVLNSPLPWAIGAPGTTNYSILRQPRPVGDEKLQLPEGLVIDLSTNIHFGVNPLPINMIPDQTTGVAVPAYVDILFSPSGAVLTNAYPPVSTETINLWVRQPDPTDTGSYPAFIAGTGKLPNYFNGNPTLIAIFVRTGLVAAYSPDTTGANPYLDVK